LSIEFLKAHDGSYSIENPFTCVGSLCANYLL
jgi:hypothetical protein